ncbi:MAG: hypothetical protein F2550_03530 [Actinobacteria bacterium]|nr:hypothetical protein [Actinomycetota bacterium]
MRTFVNKTIVGGKAQSSEMHLDWTVELHQDFDFDRFLTELPLTDQVIVVRAVQAVLREHGNRLAGTHWVTALGAGLFEFRISAPQLLIRIFFTYQAQRVILLLAAYDKQRDPSQKRQQREIAQARKRIQNA